jgi:hypothetical protein
MSHSGKITNKETSKLKNTIYQMNLTNICRLPLPTAPECTFFSATYGTFSKTGGHKASLNIDKKTEITSLIFSDHIIIKS